MFPEVWLIGTEKTWVVNFIGGRQTVMFGSQWLWDKQSKDLWLQAVIRDHCMGWNMVPDQYSNK